MSALKQYIDLYDANASAIAAGSAGALNAARGAARRALEQATLPVKGDEGFEKTSVDEMFAPDYGVNIGRVDLPVDLAETFRCDVPNMSTLLGVVANDKFVATPTLVKNLPAGVTVMSLAQAAEVHRDTVDRHYGSAAPVSDPGAALNTLLAQDGVFIKIGRGVKLEKPIQIVNIFSSGLPLAAFRRVLIVAEDDSAADILFCDHSRGDSRLLSSQVVEIICHSRSRVHVYDIEESSAATSRRSQMFVKQGAGSTFLANSTTLLNGTTRNDFDISIDGEGCSTGLYGMAIGSGRQHVDNSSRVVHEAPRCTSNQLFRYVLDEQSSGAFEGSIEVTPAAPFTEAYQSNNNVLASAEARMHTKPQLLIYNDDVKCSHGASTGQLDNQALFYMQTRGIPLAEARKMLMQAFMADVIATVSLEGVRDRLRHLVEKRFDGTLASCQSCAGTCKSQH